MATTLRLLVAASCIAAAQASILQLQYRYAVVDGTRLRIGAEDLPLQLNGWQGEPTELDPALIEKIGAGSTASRLYRNEDGREGSVHLAVYPTSGPSVPHHPHVCYPGSGWTILSEEWQLENDQRRYQLMQAARDDATVLVAYWYQIGDDVVSNHGEARKKLQQLRQQGVAFPPTVKVLIQVPIGFSKDEAAQTVRELAAPIYDWIAKNSLTN